jgi:hypothetical protein
MQVIWLLCTISKCLIDALLLLGEILGGILVALGLELNYIWNSIIYGGYAPDGSTPRDATHGAHTICTAAETVTETAYKTVGPTGWFCAKMYGR